MGPILPFGYFSAAFLTVVVAVVIGAFWVGWGLLSPAGDAARDTAPSPVEGDGKGDAFTEIASVPSAKEKKDAGMGMAPAPAEREEGKDAIAVDHCAATAVEVERKVHEFVEDVGVAVVAGKERALPDMALPSTAEREEKEDCSPEIAPVDSAKEKKDDLTEMVPAPAASVEEKDPLAADVCAVPPMDGDKKVHDIVEEVGVDLVATEEKTPADTVPSTAEREEEKKTDASTERASAPTLKEEKDALTETAPPPMLREDEKDALAVDHCAAPAVEGENKVHDIVEEVDVAEVVGKERDVPVEVTVKNMNKADAHMRSEAADKPEIGELTLEELKAYDGTDAERPLLLAIKENIYDVSRSRLLYGPGCHYELFGGRDVTRALALMSFEPEDLTGKIDDLKKAELEVLGDWEQKFMEKYPRVGRLAAVESGDGKQRQ